MTRTTAGLSVGPDAVPRCWWAGGGGELYARYHDDEWGVPVADDRRLFEKVSLEGFDVATALGFSVAVANPCHEAWRWTKVKRKTDKDAHRQEEARPAQHAVDDPLVAQRQGVERLGQREDDVEVFDGQQLRGAPPRPPRAGGRLALG